MGDWLFGLITGIILTLLVGWGWRRRVAGFVVQKRCIRVFGERRKGEDDSRGNRPDR